MKNIVIIGAGQAGARAAFMLKESGWDGKIILIGEEEYLPYERPALSKEFLNGEHSLDSLYIATPEQYHLNNIIVLTQTKVVEISTSSNTIKTDKSEIFQYEKLIFATGASARTLSVDGAHLKGLHTLRNINDAHALNAALSTAKNVVILGGGFIGLEVAAAARKLDITTTVIEQNTSCLNRVLPPEAAEPIITYHQKNNVNIICGKSILSLNGTTHVKSLTLSDGTCIPADLVVVGIGSIANDELARKIGLNCENGILVNHNCQTSIENIYAIGDVASQYDSEYAKLMRLESWENAEKQATKAAEHIISQFDNSSISIAPWFWTDQYDLNVQVIGKPILGSLTSIRINQNSDQQTQFYFQQQLLVGAVLFNNGKDKRTISKLIGKKIDPDALSNPEIALKIFIS